MNSDKRGIVYDSADATGSGSCRVKLEAKTLKVRKKAVFAIKIKESKSVMIGQRLLGHS